MCKCALNIRECDRLEGASNLIPWNPKLQVFMEEVELWEHVKQEIATYINSMKLATHNKKEAKEKETIIDLVENHFILHIAKKNINQDMFEALVCLFKVLVFLTCSCKISF